MTNFQVRVLTLNKSENLETSLFRLEKEWHLRFVLGPSLHASTVRLFCNHPPNVKTVFNRATYFELEWKSSANTKCDNHDIFAEVKICAAGSFNYYFTIDNSGVVDNANGNGYFLVDPTLNFGLEDEQLSLDCIQCQSVISKLLGPFDEWEGRLFVAKASGYNMIHFTPIQALGSSNSAYSLKDQLQLNPAFSKEGHHVDFHDIEALVHKMSREWTLLSMTDLVLNHTADNSPWLHEHPECAVNLENSPHLKPAYLLDRILMLFSVDVSEGKYTNRGVPNVIDDDIMLQKMKDILLHEVLPLSHLHDFYVVNEDDILSKFRHGVEENREITKYEDDIRIIQDPQFRRNMCRVDIDTAIKLHNIDRNGASSRAERIRVCTEHLKQDIEKLNNVVLAALHDHLHTAIDNFIANVRWRFIDPNGPKIGTVCKKNPLMHSYFTVPEAFTGSLEIEESAMHCDSAKYIFVCNGWVLGDNPLKNFTSPGSCVYLRREMIISTDSVKLNYGEKPEDCPYLWQRMKEYTELTAKIFHAVRLDNCHSTPIHVAEYMMDAARRIRHDLYVIAELFTGSEEIDNLYINRLGINSLIRESMSVHTSHDLGALIYKYGGIPVGAFYQPRIKPLMPTSAHAILFDQTHDNESLIQTRSAYGMLPAAAVVSMAYCATASNRGFEQMVPHQIDIVSETRKYLSWATWDCPERPFINQTFGIIRAKTLLNELHISIGGGGNIKSSYNHEIHNFPQVYVDDVTSDTLAITRHNPLTHDSIVLVARTAFHHPQNPDETGYIRSITVQGIVETVLFEIQTCHTDAYAYQRDPDYINGLPDYYLKIEENIPVSKSRMIKVNLTEDRMKTVVHFPYFTPGSVIAFRSVLPATAYSAILEIRKGLSQFGYLMKSYSGHIMLEEAQAASNFHTIIDNLDLLDLNVILYKTKAEEEADEKGFSVYNIPNYGDTNYCGIRGITTVLGTLRNNNDLGHQLCVNLRAGDWLPSYVTNRLLSHSRTKELGKWFEHVFGNLGRIPRFLIPSYFDAIITGAYLVLRARAFTLMTEFVQGGSTFVQALAMASIAFCGYLKNSRLPALSPNLEPPRPPLIHPPVMTRDGLAQFCCTVAAGFPHFGCGYVRNWGRDTFISMKGLLLLTGRYQEARYLILAYAGCLRHGLIPNLLNEGHSARYNSRDAVWWWLHAIHDYCRLVPGGIGILQDKVSRLYPTDDSEPLPAGQYEMLLFEVMQEALQKHATGMKFRERHAGTSIDEHMTDDGFEIEFGIRWDLGFVYGGNEHNCGTWMDKMGTSTRAGNKGKPATPRDGTAVELVGLSAAVIKWLEVLHLNGLYPFRGVNINQDGTMVKMTFKMWHKLIRTHFENKFWVHTEPVPNEQTPALIFRRGIYKDTINATQFWCNTQLRPNFPIAMVVAPDLFTPEKAWIALKAAEEYLLGPLGMKTLDPSDWWYVPYYDTDLDSDDAKFAKGFSYHQGPEWLWPAGFFMRAKLIFAKILEPSHPGILNETVLFIKTALTKHYEEVVRSPWRSLPQLTNHKGAPNNFGCTAQAWSVAAILDILHDIEMLETVKVYKKCEEHHGVSLV